MSDLVENEGVFQIGKSEKAAETPNASARWEEITKGLDRRKHLGGAGEKPASCLCSR